jgi:hypothetical protein
VTLAGRSNRCFCLALGLISSACSGSGVAPAEGDPNGGATAGGSGGNSTSLSGGAGGSAAFGGSGGSAGAASGGNPNAGGASVGGSGGLQSGGAQSGGPTTCVDAEPSDPAPASTWVNATGNLANMSAACGNLSRVAAKPCSRTLLAGVADKGLWSSDDAGATWTALGQGNGSAVITNNPLSIVFDPEHPDIFWETGLFGSGGLFTSADAGQTFAQLGTKPMTQLVSVDFSDPERKTLVFGTHGEKQQVYRSTDGGQNFTNIGETFPADAHNSESPIVIDAQTYVLGACGTSDAGVCGIHRTTDSGATWTQVSDLKVSHYAAPLWASDGSIYWPLLFSAGMAKSTDQGQTFTTVIENTVKDVTPVELPDGSLLSVGADHVLRSTDGGVSFEPVGEALPFTIDGGNNGGVAYSPRMKTLFVWHFDCGTSVAANAIMKAGYDFE